MSVTDPKTTWRRARRGAIAALLLLPLVGMALTDAVAWTAADFAAAAALLIGAEAVHEFAGARARIAIGAGLILAVGLVWVQGAVGLV